MFALVEWGAVRAVRQHHPDLTTTYRIQVEGQQLMADDSAALKARIADVAEQYFRALEKDGYRPEGCNGDDLASHLVSNLQLSLEWAVQDRYGIKRTGLKLESAANSIADRINTRYAEENKYVAGSAMAAPNAEPVSRVVGHWSGGDA